MQNLNMGKLYNKGYEKNERKILQQWLGYMSPTLIVFFKIEPELGTAQPQFVMHRTDQYAHFFFSMMIEVTPVLKICL